MSASGGAPFKFSAHAEDPRRRGKRHETDLQCSLGTVLDLSKVGMRVACKGKPALKIGQQTKVRLQIPEGNLNLKARAVWIKRNGFRTFHMGIEFIEVSRPVMAALESIAEFGFLGFGADSSSEAGATIGGSTSNAKVKPAKDPNLPDYYKVLQIGRHASAQQIRDAFRRLAREYHPDVSSDPRAAENFQRVHEAYEILRNNESRKTYDLKLTG
jgi:hypothetical protein